MSPETRAVTCQACGWLVLRRAADVMEAARQAVEHAAATGCEPADALISPVGRSPR